jgi:hypothetical protein
VNPASIAALSGALALAAGGIITAITARRTTRGRIGTSEAAILWEQAQGMRAEERARADKAEEQRDRLIESQASQLLPALASIDGALRLITDALARLEARP